MRSCLPAWTWPGIADDEAAADAKGIEFLKNSPYKDKLGQAGLFLRAAADAAPHVPHLFGAHLGNGLTEGNNKAGPHGGVDQRRSRA